MLNEEIDISEAYFALENWSSSFETGCGTCFKNRKCGNWIIIITDVVPKTILVSGTEIVVNKAVFASTESVKVTEVLLVLGSETVTNEVLLVLGTKVMVTRLVFVSGIETVWNAIVLIQVLKW